MSNHKMVLRVKSLENSKAKRRKEDVDEDYEAPKRSQTVKKKANSKSKNKSTDFDPKKPKKPPTAFFYFLEDFRKGYQEQNPNVKSMRDIGKACGEKWKTMTYEEKVQYYDIATEKRAEFERALQEYNKKKELGEDEESEDDSEFDE